MSIIIPLLTILCGCIGLYVGWRFLASAAKVRRWPSAPGRITARQAVHVEAWPHEPYWRTERGMDLSWEPRASYAYDVQGKPYTNDRIYHIRRRCVRSTAEKVCAELPDDVTVRYNPANPAESCLSFGPPLTTAWIGIVFGGAAVLTGVLLLLVRLLGGPESP